MAMSHAGSPPSSGSKQGTWDMKVGRSGAILILSFFCSILVAVGAISSSSLWPDEFGTWFFTRADSVADWWEKFGAWRDADTQLVLYHFLMYGWTKVVGTGAAAMRASNFIMFAMANFALVWPFRSRPIVAFAVILTSCLSATLWYYLNEIRPYIMLYTGACLMVGGTIEMMASQQKARPLGMTVFCLGAVVSSGASVLGVAWAASAALFVLIYWLAVRKNSLSDILSGNYLTLAIAALCIAALLAHDVRMFALGARPTLLYETDVLTVLFSFYANVGLLGVGPGMLDMRASGVATILPYIPIVAFSATMFGFVAIGGFLKVRSMLGNRTMGLLIGCAVLPVLFTLVLGFILHWRVLPRHLIPLVSLFSLLYAFGLEWWWRRRVVGRAIALISVAIMSYSSLSVRYAPRHAKDDYKHAAELAEIELARNGRVWWIADLRGALYYGIPYASDEFQSPKARHIPGVAAAPDPGWWQVDVAEKTFSILSAQEPPTLVLLSKSQYDPQNVVNKYLSVNKYQLVESFPAFTAWKR
jgi:hypothetical protein